MERIQVRDRYRNITSKTKICVISFLALFIVGACVLIVSVMHLGKEVKQEKSQAKQVKQIQGEKSTPPYSSKIPAVTVKKVPDRTTSVTTTTTVKTTTVIIPACPTGWTQFRESCYKPFNLRKNWDNAQYACSSFNPGRKSMLVEIKSEQENEFLLTIFDVRRNFWTGGNDRANEGQYVWNSDNQRFTYTNWKRGQPRSGSYQHGRRENCMLVEGGDDEMWHDYPCSNRFRYICEMNAI